MLLVYDNLQELLEVRAGDRLPGDPVFDFDDVASSGPPLHALEDDILSTILRGRREARVEAKILKGCRKYVLKDTPFDVSKLFAIPGNRADNVTNEAIHEGNNSVARAVRVCWNCERHFQKLANRQSDCTAHASTRKALGGFKKLS